MSVKSLDRYIETTPGVVGGKPRISGRRITVQNIAVWHEQAGLSIDEICAEYKLSLAEVHAGLAYYFDHRQEIDHSIKSSGELVEALRQETSSVLQARLKALRGE
jgi:uncharacterized protein (DUF433 family)